MYRSGCIYERRSCSCASENVLEPQQYRKATPASSITGVSGRLSRLSELLSGGRRHALDRRCRTARPQPSVVYRAAFSLTGTDGCGRFNGFVSPCAEVLSKHPPRRRCVLRARRRDKTFTHDAPVKERCANVERRSPELLRRVRKPARITASPSARFLATGGVCVSARSRCSHTSQVDGSLCLTREYLDGRSALREPIQSTRAAAACSRHTFQPLSPSIHDEWGQRAGRTVGFFTR